MIPRYSIKEIDDIFSEESRYRYFLKVELASLKVFLNNNQEYKKIEEKAHIDLKRIHEIEDITKHDVIAFCRSIDEQLGEEKRWFHYNLTSTDVVDSANSLALKDVNEIIEKDLNILLETFKRIALDNKETYEIGRTHGVHAELTTFGFKFLNFYQDLKDAIELFSKARKDVEVIKLSGAVGNYYHFSKEHESKVAKILNLNDNKVSTQVLSRNRYSTYLYSLSNIGQVLNKVAIELRHLSRTEVMEVSEGFSSGQKGSSAMPHKKNPIGLENISGLSRLLTSYLFTSLENIPLWHERDISHSSNERIVFLDSTTLVCYIVRRMNSILNNLVIFKDNMSKNIELTQNRIYSGVILNYLILKYVDYSREELYDKIQSLTFKSSEENKDFIVVLKEDSFISKLLTNEEIESLCKKENVLKGIDEAYLNVLKD